MLPIGRCVWIFPVMLRLGVELSGRADRWVAPRLGVCRADATKSNTGDKVEDTGNTVIEKIHGREPGWLSH